MGVEDPRLAPSVVRGRLDPSVARARLLVRRSLTDVRPESLVLVACSGGADSLALLSVAAFESRRGGWRCGAVVVDHRLQDGSADVAANVVETARRLGADPVECVAVDVGSSGGPEGAARQARYDALRAVAARTGAAAVLLGHTLDDQAEGVLLGLARGSGIRSLAGMAPRDCLWRRPFLGLRRTDTVAVCRATGLDWWDDPHNGDPSYARARVRDRVLPVLEGEIGPGVAAALARTAMLARDDADLLDALASDLATAARRPDGDWDIATLVAAPAALRSRVLRSAALLAGCSATDLNAGHVQALGRLLDDWHGQSGIDLPGPVRAWRSATTLRLEAGAVTG